MARILARTAGLSRAEWLQARRQGIGGSDAAIVLGLNPYQSLYGLWLDKTGQQPLDDGETDAQALGHALEDAVARRAASRLGLRIRRRNVILVHDQLAWMIADLDRDIIGAPALMECKTINPQRWRRAQEQPGGLPLEWVVQVQHYLAVTGYATAWLAIYVLGQGLEIRRVDADPDFQAGLIQAEAAFWQLVQRREPPAVDGSPATVEALSRAWLPVVEETVQILGPEDEEAVRQYRDLGQEIDRLQAERDAVGNRLRAHLGPATAGVTPGGWRITWKPQTRRTVDWAWLATVPGSEAHVTITTNRPLKVRPPKEASHGRD